MQLRSFDYYTDRKTEGAGMARLATLIRRKRAKAEAQGHIVLTLDNGDSLQGTPLDEQAIAADDGPHIFYRALDLMTYDAAGLGNHDFNFDLDHLSASLEGAPLPILCANARRLDGGSLPVERWTVFDRVLQGSPLRVGVFSVLPPQTLIWDADHLAGRVAIDDITQTARTAIAALQECGCDVIVALAHTGLGERHEKPGQENALWPLSTLDGLDAIVGGHTHLRLPDPGAPVGSDTARGLLNGTPVVMPGVGGAHLGVIDLDLARTATGGWAVASGQARLDPTHAGEDADVTRITDPLHRATRVWLSRRVGYTPVPLHSYFGFLAPSPALELVAGAKAHALRALGCVPDDLPLLSAVAPAKMGGRGGPENYVDIPAGPLNLRHVFDLCIFPNRLAAVIVTGTDLADWIEMSAGLFNTIAPGRGGQILLNPDRPAHGSDLFYGVEYTLDLTRPSRFGEDGVLVDPGHRRLTSLRYRGRDVRPEHRFAVALSSYRANGGGNVRALERATRFAIPNLLVRQCLLEYLDQNRFADRAFRSPCQFNPIPGAEVIVATGPGAAPYLGEISDINCGSDGLDANGFERLRLRL
ncbi:MAG: bifunctional metallophosphatase/5'-nucleotidase [Aestuariivita sp.]|nr:bifunctional metallophosphatase/5'-nucleotidase [Aestuariivita sp.]